MLQFSSSVAHWVERWTPCCESTRPGYESPRFEVPQSLDDDLTSSGQVKQMLSDNKALRQTWNHRPNYIHGSIALKFSEIMHDIAFFNIL